MSKKLILLVLAIVSSALVFGCNTATAERPDMDEIFSFGSIGFLETDNITVENCSLGMFIIYEPHDRGVDCIELSNGEIGLALTGTTQPLSFIEVRGIFASDELSFGSAFFEEPYYTFGSVKSCQRNIIEPAIMAGADVDVVCIELPDGYTGFAYEGTTEPLLYNVGDAIHEMLRDAIRGGSIDEVIFSVQSYENGLFEQIFGDTVAECNVFVFSVPEIRERNVICIELANGETGLAYRSSANEPLTISEAGMALNVPPMVDFGG